jgi:RHS repeat-associated protein
MTLPLLRPIVRVIIVAIIAFVGLTAAPGMALAQPPPETVEYYATDALGSVRVVFTPTGQVIGRSDYLPFGDTLDQSGMLPRQRFTGQERDGVAGLDDFNARSLQMRTGRMSRPDPLFGNAPVNPQRWNAYSYVTNNPLGFVDPSGMDMVDLPVFKVTVAGYPCSLTNCVTVTGQLGNRLLLDEFRVGGFFWGMGGDLPAPGSVVSPEPEDPGGGGGGGQPPPSKPAPPPETRATPCQPGPEYLDRYLQHVATYTVNVGPYASALLGGLWPKSWAPATVGRGPLLGSTNPLTSVPRALGIPGAGLAVVQVPAALIGVATVGVGWYNIGVFATGFVYAIPSYPGCEAGR